MELWLNLRSLPEGQEPILRQMSAKYARRALSRGRGYTVKLLYQQVLDEDAHVSEAEVLSCQVREDGSVSHLSLHRPGSGFHLEFRPGTSWESSLSSPGGPVKVYVRTKSLYGEFLEDSFRLHLCYELSLAGSPQGITVIDIAGQAQNGVPGSS